jgi:itaconate CoA-transferase
VISIQNEREWADFCRSVLQRPELVDDPRCNGNAARVEHRTFVDGVVSEVFGALTSGAVVDRLTAAQTAFGQVNSVLDLIQHAQLRTRSMVVNGKTVEVPNSPWGMEWDTPYFPAAPSINEHGAKIRAEFGHTLCEE